MSFPGRGWCRWWLGMLLVVSLVTGSAAATITLDGIDAPDQAVQGETVSAMVTASGDDAGFDLTVKLFRMDTKAKLCEATVSLPGTVGCSGEFQMPTADVRLRAYIRVNDRITQDTDTIVAVETSTPTPTPAADDSSDGTGDGRTTPTHTPVDIGGGEVRDDPALPADYTVNNSTGLIGSTDGSADSDSRSGDDDGLLGDVIGGLTETAQDGFISVLTDFVKALVTGLIDELVKAIAAVLMTLPQVHPNPAVTEIHQLSLTVTFALTTLAVAITGLLYQVGPILGISYKQTRLLIPRIIIALAFALVSLPVLQLTVDLANALTVAFTPDLVSTRIGDAVNTGAAVILAYLINAMMLLAVVAVYVLRDVYVLFIAAISPLIALAWAMPRTQRYASAFIGGWWTALAMGPLAMLVLHFTFALMHGGATPIQGVTNWLYALAAWVLLLWIPFQLYGASQSMAMHAFRLSRGAEQRARHAYRQRTGDDTAEMPGGDRFQQEHTVNEGTGPDWSEEEYFED